MEPKRELSSVDLAALARELAGHAGAKVDKAYLYGEDLVRLKLRDFDRGRLELLLEVGEVKRAHTADPERVPDAPGRPPDFAMKLRSRLSGAELVDVSQYEFDRILALEFDRDDGSTTVVVELFGDGNVAVLDEAGDVVDSLETVRLKSRTVAPGAPYEYPESRLDPLSVDRETFVARMEDSTTDVVRTLATQLNLGGFWAEELCTRAGVQKGLDIEAADDETYDAVYEALDGLAATLEAGEFDPRVYHEDDRPVDVAPMPLAERGDLPTEAYDSFNAALDHYFHELRQSDEEESAEVDRPDFEAEISKRERIVEQQENAIEEFDEQAERERERAELLYANYDLVDEVLSTVRSAREDGVPWDDIADRLAEGAEQGIPAAEVVVDVDGAEGRVTVVVDDHEISLDPAHGVEKNADRIYREAKRVEEKKEGAMAAIEDTREELAHWQQRRERYESAEDPGAAEDEADEGADDGDDSEDRDWLSMESVPVRSEEHWYEQFRWFHTSDGFLVLGGRDAEDNEALVKKYLEGGDQFFHAQAHGGPATILKATGPSEPAREIDFPESSLEQAAQFAVSYSSVWKDGHYAGDVYAVDADQVSKTPESGEFLEKGGFAIRGDRTYYDDTPVDVAVGIQCEPETRVVGGPPEAIEGPAETTVRVEPGKFAQGDVAKRIYREFRERFSDTAFVRKVASPDRIQHFLPPGGSRIAEE
jgi:predicted ribosome quality control (RQC) complex YloA/Tae2 family protein